MDGALPHRAQSTKARFEADQIQLLDWPPNSPDLNPIEALGKLMNERIAHRRQRPRAEEEMQQAIQEEWDKINEEDLYRLIASIRQLVRDVTKAEGGITK